MTNPITPPPELLKHWEDLHFDEGENYDVMLIQAYQAGADQELKACCDHIRDYQWGFVDRPDGTKMHRAVDLELARRPKPPSLKEQALNAHNRMMAGAETQDDWAIVRRALEALDD